MSLKKVILYSAMSLDGFIARENGDVSWLDEVAHPEGEDYGYHQFYDGVDITIMGNNTYNQVKSFGVEFPYKATTNYVFTSQKQLKDNQDVKYISTDHIEFVQDLKKQGGKNIWLIGGGALNNFFLINDLIDEMILHTMPVVLGAGIPLFGKFENTAPIELLGHRAFEGGVVEQRYRF